MPRTIELLRVPNLVPELYEFAEYRRLVDAARALDPRALLVVLLAGDAGLRSSEMMDCGRRRLQAAQRAALVTVSYGPHVLRHTFCVHLAMRAAAAKASQELAGHASLTTTHRYMHPSPAARQSAIRLLNRRDGASDLEKPWRRSECRTEISAFSLTSLSGRRVQISADHKGRQITRDANDLRRFRESEARHRAT